VKTTGRNAAIQEVTIPPVGSGRRHDRSVLGFSIPELLTVMAIMALMITFAGPAMATAYKAYKVRVAANGVTTQLRASRYTAVTNRDTRTVDFNDEDHGSAPNQYSFINSKGKALTMHLALGVKIDNTSEASLQFNSNGSTSSTSTVSVAVSMDINATRGDRYTINVSPSGTVTADLTKYTP
jgi:prepilin-type N-terminal cleavage/methylation domain-containing protein